MNIWKDKAKAITSVLYLDDNIFLKKNRKKKKEQLFGMCYVYFHFVSVLSRTTEVMK